MSFASKLVKNKLSAFLQSTPRGSGKQGYWHGCAAAPLFRPPASCPAKLLLPGFSAGYDRENPLVERDLVVHGLELALAGWMAIVPGNASNGFRKLLAGTNHE